jgi:hypothetical protein
LLASLLMKYFTLDKWIADQNPDFVDTNEIVHTGKAYQEYLASIADRLPPELNRLRQTIHLGDAWLRQLDIDLAGKRITLVMDAEEVTTRAYRQVTLHYEDIRRFVSVSDPVKGLPGPYGYGDMGNDEIELLDEDEPLFEHRFLFSSGIEIAIQFGGFSFS